VDRQAAFESQILVDRHSHRSSCCQNYMPYKIDIVQTSTVQVVSMFAVLQVFRDGQLGSV